MAAVDGVHGTPYKLQVTLAEKDPMNSPTPPSNSTQIVVGPPACVPRHNSLHGAYGPDGLRAIEVWGGATFDTTHRFLGDDPSERIRTIKGILKKHPHRYAVAPSEPGGLPDYADDLTYRFVRYTAEAGVDVFRSSTP